MPLAKCPESIPQFSDAQDTVLVLVKQYEHLLVVRDLLLCQVVF